MKKNSQGFSLIELLIVVAIILIIAAIAIPDLLKSRQAAQQASAVGSLRTVNTSEVTYSSTYTTGFSSSLADLDGPSGGVSSILNAGLIDSILASGIKSAYGFEYQANLSATQPCTNPPTVGAAGTPPIASYSINASPLLCVAGNGNYYYTDQSGVIRMNNTAEAGPTDAPLAG
jgi:type IV pilus assembly protein PilA